MSSEADRRLHGVLDRELDAARALAITLDAERAALTGTSPETVADRAAQKTELFRVLESLEAERRELCVAAAITLPAMRSGASPATPGPGISDGVANRWRALLELIAGCRKSNEINGYIINARRGQLNQLFHVLRGGPPVIYSPQGRTFAKSLRELARA